MGTSITLDGRLTRDPEIHFFPSGKASVKLSVAVDRGRKNANDEWITDFYQVQSYRDSTVKAVNEGRLAKGRQVVIYGAGEFYQQTIGDRMVSRFVVSADRIIPMGPNPPKPEEQPYENNEPGDASYNNKQSYAQETLPVEKEIECEDPFKGME